MTGFCLGEYGVVRRVDAATGTITTVAGGLFNRTGPDWSCVVADGDVATATCLFMPSGVALDGAGNLFVCNSDSDFSGSVDFLRRVDAPTGTITAVARH